MELRSFNYTQMLNEPNYWNLPDLVIGDVNLLVGFDPRTHDVESLGHPASDLDAACRSVGLACNKRENVVQNTVNCLSYDHFYLELSQKYYMLYNLIVSIENFLVLN